MPTDKFPKPFLKWAGGKTRMLPHILSHLKQDKFNYHEPFVGAGAVFFALSRGSRIQEGSLNDHNSELITTYRVISQNVDNLILELRKPKYRNNQIAFLKMRKADTNKLSDIEIAARFIYLNKTCFNGLYRVNRKNQFNVPFGKYEDPVILDVSNLRKVSESLASVSLNNLDFESVLNTVKAGDVVYFDPPYIPLNKTSFTEYTDNGFSYADHARLASVFDDLVRQNVFCMLSNSSSPESFKLYSKHVIHVFDGTSNISGFTEARKTVREILVTPAL